MAYPEVTNRRLLLIQPEQTSRDLRPAGGVDFTGTLVRVHIGLESVDDLIADLAAVASPELCKSCRDGYICRQFPWKSL